MTPYGKTAQHSIAAMSRLAEAYAEKRLLSSIDIARDRHLAQTLVAKLLTMLSQAGLVEGSRGPGGGYRLARAPGKISLLDIVSVFERLENRTVCPFGPEWCGKNDPCPLHDAYVRFGEQFDSFLRQTKLDVFLPMTPAATKNDKRKRRKTVPGRQ
jgi:Rrf2 family protein